ncbi:GNAT family N-acetyltransferase [Mahella australiensis]|nr:GNAT family N-acetyltransferase [Mahella australiensis]
MSDSVNIMMKRKLDSIDKVSLAEGCVIKQLEVADAEALSNLYNAAFGFDFQTPEWVIKEMLDNPQVKAVYGIEHDGKLVATAAIHIVPEYGETPELHWVATHPDYRGEGLGKAIVLYTLHEMKRMGFKDVLLITQPERIPAIKLYLSIGFTPEVGNDEDK